LTEARILLAKRGLLLVAHYVKKKSWDDSTVQLIDYTPHDKAIRQTQDPFTMIKFAHELTPVLMLLSNQNYAPFLPMPVALTN